MSLIMTLLVFQCTRDYSQNMQRNRASAVCPRAYSDSGHGQDAWPRAVHYAALGNNVLGGGQRQDCAQGVAHHARQPGSSAISNIQQLARQLQWAGVTHGFQEETSKVTYETLHARVMHRGDQNIKNLHRCTIGVPMENGASARAKMVLGPGRQASSQRATRAAKAWPTTSPRRQDRTCRSSQSQGN